MEVRASPQSREQFRKNVKRRGQPIEGKSQRARSPEPPRLALQFKWFWKALDKPKRAAQELGKERARGAWWPKVGSSPLSTSESDEVL